MLFGRCYCHIAIWMQLLFFLFGWCCSLVAILHKVDGDVFTIRLMFLPYLLMVLPIFCGWSCYHIDTVAQELCHLCLFYFGWCYCQDGWCCCHLEVLGRCYSPVADVVATVYYFCRLMLLPCGWCCCHFYFFFFFF